jgi:hypothetical protein
METLARELKASHETWMETPALAKPGSEPSQIASEAREIAIKELEDRLPSAASPDDWEALDAAMAFVRRHTSNE